MKFQKMAAAHDAAATMQALLAWLDYSKISGSPATLERFYTLAGDPELKKQIKSLETFLYTVKHDRQWSGNQLSTAVQQARKNFKKRQSQAKQPDLPALNPQAACQAPLSQKNRRMELIQVIADNLPADQSVAHLGPVELLREDRER